jgi:hypothetical protein
MSLVMQHMHQCMEGTAGHRAYACIAAASDCKDRDSHMLLSKGAQVRSFTCTRWGAGPMTLMLCHSGLIW